MSYRDLLGSGDRTAGHDHPVARRIDTSLAMLADHEALAAEVVQLRRALKSRATIDQAKGMLMAQHHCDADVALALVYQATRPADPDPI